MSLSQRIVFVSFYFCAAGAARLFGHLPRSEDLLLDAEPRISGGAACSTVLDLLVVLVVLLLLVLLLLLL